MVTTEQSTVDCYLWPLEGLRELRNALEQFVLPCLKERFPLNWKDKGLEIANTRQNRRTGELRLCAEGERITHWEDIQCDAYKLLNFVHFCYDKTLFAKKLERRGERLIKRLIDIRNTPSHDQTLNEIADTAAAYDVYSELFKIVKYQAPDWIETRKVAMHAILAGHARHPSATWLRPISLAAIALVAAITVILFARKFHNQDFQMVSQPSRIALAREDKAFSQPHVAPTSPVETDEPTQKSRNRDLEESNKYDRTLPKDVRRETVSYLNLLVPETPLVLIVDSATHRIDPNTTDGIAMAIHGEGGAFRPEFVSSGLFDKAFDGDAAPLRQLNLDSVPLVVLGKRTANVSALPSVDPDYQRALTTLTVRVYRPTKGFTSRSFSVDAKGPGFVAGDAVRAADDQVVKELLARLNETP